MQELSSRIDAARARLGASRIGVLLARLRRSLAPAARAVRIVVGLLEPVRRRYRGLARGWHRGVLYHDGRVTLDKHGITVHGYYMPFGRKRIPYGQIREVYEWSLSGSRSYRVHGPGRGRVWYARDPRRGQRTVALLLDIGTWLCPVITPDEPGRVRDLLRERLHHA